MSKYSQFFAIIKKMGLTKEEAVKEFTGGRTDSLSSLLDGEFRQLMRVLEQFNVIPPGDRMRKKLIGLAKSMNWGASAVSIIPKLDNWLLKQKFKKPLMRLTESELAVMVSVFESGVYAGYLKAMSK